MKRIYTLLLAVITVGAAVGQDIHFSQFFNAPLLLNPALTGFTPGAYRIGVNYRNQWFTTAGGNFGRTPYMTTAAGGDVPIKVKNDVVGVGLFLDNDQSGANTFSQVSVVASASYIKTLGKKNNHHLSAGFQLGFTTTSVNSSNFQWANQFQDNVFVSTIPPPSYASTGKLSYTYANVNAGLLWYGKFTDIFGMYAGTSFFNLDNPKIDVVAGDNQHLYIRWSIHGGFDITIAKKYHILPSLMYMRQGPDNEINSGLGFGIDFDPDLTLTLGLYNRISTIQSGASPDAIIPYVAVEYKGFKFGISYDATLSQWKNAGSGVGALELSISYTGKRKNYDFKNALICPRF